MPWIGRNPFSGLNRSGRPSCLDELTFQVGFGDQNKEERRVQAPPVVGTRGRTL